jgi:hypothetical protein
MCLFFVVHVIEIFCVSIAIHFSFLQTMFMLKCLLILGFLCILFVIQSFVEKLFLDMPNESNDGGKSLMC